MVLYVCYFIKQYLIYKRLSVTEDDDLDKIIVLSDLWFAGVETNCTFFIPGVIPGVLPAFSLPGVLVVVIGVYAFFNIFPNDVLPLILCCIFCAATDVRAGVLFYQFY